MDIYFDTCALNRLTDDLSQQRVRAEADAVARILELVVSQQLRWIASSILRYEIERNPDPIRRLDALSLLSGASKMIALTPEAHSRAAELSQEGFSPFDALHLATAQQAGVDWFITTDDRFLHRARQRPELSHPELVNPVDFLQRRHPWLLP